MPLSRAELEEFRARLEANETRLMDELAGIEIRTSSAQEAETATELSGAEDHPADLASETYEREKDVAMGESLESALSRVRAALDKLQTGTYGICDACGEEIPLERLRMLPFATLCIKDQRRMEST